MVEGAGGTSAYTDGSASATIPVNDPDHNLSKLTISFYYQRNSAAAKHILLAAGPDGSQAGNFSIEVLANGRLRGYHVGQDAQLRFFESTNGITGTDLQVGTAHRIDLTLGSSGARIYLDGVPLTNAFILANTNGWNNAQIKFLGIFTDAVSSPADGAFDRFRIWNRALTPKQIAALEPAQSISLPAKSPSGVSVDALTAFQASRIQVTKLPGWPSGRTPKQVVTQGTHAHGYVRRSWKPSNNDGTWMDFQAGWRKTSSPDTIRIALDNGQELNLSISVTHSIPSPGSGGTTRVLNASGGGDYTDWNTAIAALRTNDVLVVRAPAGNFVYTQNNNGGGPTSTANGVKIVAHPDDLAAGRRPRIHVQGSTFKRYADDLNNGHWVLHQDLGGSHGKIWKTAQTFAAGSIVNVGCSYRTVGGGLRRCFTYTNTPGTPGALARLTDTTYPRVEVDQPDVPSQWALYMGPGIYLHSDNKLYIRLTPLTDGIGALQVNKSLGTGFPNPPWNWAEDGPQSTDPNQCQLFISSSNDSATIGVTTNTSYILRINSTSNWVIENLDFIGGGDTIQMRDGTNHTIRGCRFLGWAPPYMPDGTRQDTIRRRHNMFAAVNTFGLLCERCEFWGGTPPWVGWSDNKGQMGAYSLAAAATTMWYMQGLSDTTVSFSGTFRNCLMDGWVCATKPGGTPQFIKFHNCSLRYWGLDGAIATQNPSEKIDHIRCQLFEGFAVRLDRNA
jgi:hypothetical protein